MTGVVEKVRKGPCNPGGAPRGKGDGPRRPEGGPDGRGRGVE